MEIIHVSKNLQKRILKPKTSLDNNVQEVNAIKKCLFGVPDVQDVENLLQEQIREDWERIKDRFGFNVEDIENMENQRLDAQTPRKRKSSGKIRAASFKRRVLFQQPYNSMDRKITEFYQVRKTALSDKKPEQENLH